MKTITFLFVAFFTVNSFAQLKVVDSKSEEIGKITNLGQLAVQCDKIGDNYMFTYRDMKFTHSTELKHFVVNSESFEQLYDMIMENWDNPPKEDIMLELKEGYLWLDFTRMFGITNIQFGHAPYKNTDIIGQSPALNKRRVKKLFGK